MNQALEDIDLFVRKIQFTHQMWLQLELEVVKMLKMAWLHSNARFNWLEIIFAVVQLSVTNISLQQLTAFSGMYFKTHFILTTITSISFS